MGIFSVKPSFVAAIQFKQKLQIVLENMENIRKTLENIIFHSVKCPYSELFWSTFSRTRTEYGEILRISPYSVRMRTRITPNTNTCYAVFISRFFKLFSQPLEYQWRASVNRFMTMANFKILEFEPNDSWDVRRLELRFMCN